MPQAPPPNPPPSTPTPHPTKPKSLSDAAFAKAKQLMPGGVSSPVRAFNAVGGTPLFIREAEGANVTDLDGRTYIDFVGSYGPMIVGHANERVVAAPPPKPKPSSPASSSPRSPRCSSSASSTAAPKPS